MWRASGGENRVVKIRGCVCLGGPRHDVAGVGKTCLLLRFVDDKFSSSFITTIGIDFKIKNIKVGDKKVKLQVRGWAGWEALRARAYGNCHLRAGVYTLTACSSRIAVTAAACSSGCMPCVSCMDVWLPCALCGFGERCRDNVDGEGCKKIPVDAERGTMWGMGCRFGTPLVRSASAISRHRTSAAHRYGGEVCVRCAGWGAWVMHVAVIGCDGDGCCSAAAAAAVGFQAIALVYDATDRESFENISNWTDQIEQVRGRGGVDVGVDV